MTYSGNIKSITQRGASNLYDVIFEDNTGSVVEASALPVALTPWQALDASGNVAAHIDPATGNLMVAQGITAGGLVSSAFTDGFVWVAPRELEVDYTPTNNAFSDSFIAGTSKNVPCKLITNTTAGESAVLGLNLSKLFNRSAAGKGVTINEIDLFLTWTVASLTGNPTILVITQKFPVVGAAAAAPTEAAAAGGVLTATNLAALTVPTAGRFGGFGVVLGTPLVLNDPLTEAYAQITIPVGNLSLVYVAGALVKFSMALN